MLRFVALTIRNSSFVTDDNSCPKEARVVQGAHAAAGTRQEVGNRLATATDSAGPQLFLKVAIALLPRLEKRRAQGK